MNLFGEPERPNRDAYGAFRDRKAREARDVSLSGRDIGPLPDVVDPERKASCERSLRAFCETYLASVFPLEWSPDHLRVIDRIEHTVLDGGLFSLAMPRGSGKSTLCEAGGLWALVYGHREFVALIGATEGGATQMLDSIKTHIESNDLLAADFPEVCHPVRSLEGIHQRAAGQLLNGQQTLIGWTSKEIVLPSIDGHRSSGAVIRVASLTGSIRGMKHTRADGTTIRPSLALIDDPQTDESARSPSQCDQRERILTGAVLGLAGPGEKIAALMTVTVVVKDDLADRMLNRETHPEWQGERTKMVYAFPTNDALWAEYARIREEGLRSGAGIKPATEFYSRHREEMDEGSRVAWPARFNHDEVSAIQHAMNLRLQDEAAFFAEYQNDPLSDSTAVDDLLSVEAIMAKVNGHKRGAVPIACSRITAFIDVQGKALFYAVVGWRDDFTGFVLDYGVEPDQRIRPGVAFTLRDLRHTLADAAPGAGQEGQIYAGLQRLTDRLLGGEWLRDDGAAMRIERCLVDANWGESTDVVYQFCRQTPHAATIIPSHGRYVGAGSIPFSDYKRKQGERVGLNWRVPTIKGKRSVRHVIYDTNWWKTFIHARLSVAMGDPGCLSLFGTNDQTSHHRVFATHLRSEHRTRTEGRGRSVDEWKLRADGVDNHWLDCLVGCAVGASMQGVTVLGDVTKAPAAKERKRLSQMRRDRR
ncbi:MAG: phage terminase large subunit family protein [Phycisphaerales bacterium]|nr:phage terminase large subunit family protein [Phycisphaerales bacterium]